MTWKLARELGVEDTILRRRVNTAGVEWFEWATVNDVTLIPPGARKHDGNVSAGGYVDVNTSQGNMGFFWNQRARVER